MTDGVQAGMDLAIAHARARCLAKAQCTPEEIKAKLVIECEMPYEQASDLVEGSLVELLTFQHAGRAEVRELLYDLARGHDRTKLTGANLSALTTFGHAHLGLNEREDMRKLVEAKERELALQIQAPKTGPTGVCA